MPSPAGPCPFHLSWDDAAIYDRRASPSSPACSTQATTPTSTASLPLHPPLTGVCPEPVHIPASAQAPDAMHPVPDSAPCSPAADTAASATAPSVPCSRALAIDVLRNEARALLAAAERLSDPAPADMALTPGECFDRALSMAMDVVRPRLSSDGKRQRRPKGKLVWCGVGKSGLIGRKLHATALSLGLKSVFLHPIEALHGDLGCVDRNDVVLAISYSGATGELLSLTPYLRARGAHIIAMCGQPGSQLVQESDAWLDCQLPLLHHPTPRGPPPAHSALGVSAYEPHSGTDTAITTPSPVSSSASCSSGSSEVYEFRESADSCCSSESSSHSLGSANAEAEPDSVQAPVHFNQDAPRTAQEPEAWAAVPAPSSSTTLALSVGDAFVFALAQRLGHDKRHFALNHPNGNLGRQLRSEREQASQQHASAAGETNLSAPVLGSPGLQAPTFALHPASSPSKLNTRFLATNEPALSERRSPFSEAIPSAS